MGWRCTVCLVTNDEDAEVCVCCEYAREKDDKKEGQSSGPIFNSSILSSSANSSCPVFTFGNPVNISNTVNDNPPSFGNENNLNSQISGFVPSFGNVEKSPTTSIETPIIQSVDIHQERNKEQKQYFDKFNSDFVDYKSFIKKVPNSDNNKIPIGTVWVWGSGECDQLGIKESLLDEDLCLKKPKRIESISRDLKIIDITSGALHNLILTDQGEVLSWGCNDDGALGRLSSRLKAKLEKLDKKGGNDKDEDEEDDDDDDDEEKDDDEEEPEDSEKYPNKIEFPEASEDCQLKVKSIISGDCYSCCLMENGEVYLWGSYKDSGGYIGFPNFQLMSGSLVGYKQYSPVRIPIFGRKKESSNSEIRGRKKIKLEKETMKVVGKAKKILGGENHTIVITQDMRIFAWGSTEFGQFGIEPVEDKMEKTKYLYPVEIDNDTLGLPSNLVIQDIYCGRASTFFVVKDVKKNIIQVFACGRNGRNELGIYNKFYKDVENREDNEDPIVFRPKKVNITDFETECSKCKSDQPIKQIGGGQYYSALLTCCGEVFIWGMKDCCGLENQLIKNGNESIIKDRDIKIPTKIEHLKSITKLGFGADSCFAIDVNGVLFVWGMNLTGQIGITKLIDSEVILNPQIMNPKTFLSENDGSDSNFVLKVVGGSQHSMGLIWNGSFSDRFMLEETEEEEQKQEQEWENEREDERVLKRMNAKRFDREEEQEENNQKLSKEGKAFKKDNKTVIKKIVKTKAEVKAKPKATSKITNKAIISKPTSRAKSKSNTKSLSEPTSKVKPKTTTQATISKSNSKTISKPTSKATSKTTSKPTSKTSSKTSSKSSTKSASETTSKLSSKATSKDKIPKSTSKAKSNPTSNSTSKSTTKSPSKSTTKSPSKSTAKSSSKTKTEAKAISVATTKKINKAKSENITKSKDKIMKTELNTEEKSNKSKASSKCKTKESNKKTEPNSKTKTRTSSKSS
ncbi:uncharacterized protein cubi_01571 [Cryptosporidium ubiquitum]|uniref:RanBP2-type domain-containing protein n=1 Tax=Cryptosporidium ubiquitum TaxID=857276 RepID=A0A1J4MDE4_9CRYT|nr:uncharacterized protein cubi_01571 [Cryptosporidium ubiquitum]OII72238.1 hypothetical protein cubi_01571 [Cryptosporidium ubiquitum]